MFDKEEEIIQRAETIVREPEYQRNKPLFTEFSRLLKAYKKLFRQFDRMVKISDRQQIELKDSQDAILRYNSKLTLEIQERRKAEGALQSANRELQRLASLDGLTRLANRRRFDEYLKQQWNFMALEKAPLSLIMCDIDFFKPYNDTYGHLQGDDCLRQVAKAIADAVRRPEDLVARYGGEEFAVVLPDTSPKDAFRVADSLAESVRSLGIIHCASPVCGTVTVSAGIAGSIPHNGFSSESLISLADQALYKAKERGRNQIILYS